MDNLNRLKVFKYHASDKEFLKEEGWQKHMERTRQAARRLLESGEIEILQKGEVVDPSTFKGPIRLRKRVH